ncbi:MAG: hypothetical protein HC859_06255, partial [Bacteroidia bacterium]|nr:hypothetical protein [Bacteroidia bacterium]
QYASSGSRGARLRLQFLTESVIMSLLSVVVGVALVQLLLPAFNQLTGVSLAFRYEPSLIIGLVVFSVAVGVLSGLYPAIVFSSFSPVKALKGNVQHGEKGAWLRNVLVTLQFTACMALIVCTVVIFNQLDFMTSRNLGFNKDQVLVLKRAWGLGDKKTAFKQQLLHLGGVQSVSFSETTPGRHFNGHGQRFAGEPQDVQHTIYPLIADKDILQTLDLELVQGQGLDAADAAHPKALLNEAAVKELNFENPLDEKIVSGTLGNTEVDIAGVVKDFQFKSLRHKLEPLVIYSLDVDNDPQFRASFVLIKINTADVRQTLATIEAEWKRFRTTIHSNTLSSATTSTSCSRERKPCRWCTPSFGHCHFHCVPGAARPHLVHGESPQQGTGHPQDRGCVGGQHHTPAVVGISQAPAAVVCRGLCRGLVPDEPLARRLYLPHRHQRLGICTRRHAYARHRRPRHELPPLQSRHAQPGGSAQV